MRVTRAEDFRCWHLTEDGAFPTIGFSPTADIRKSNVMEVDVRSTRDSAHTYRGPARPLCAILLQKSKIEQAKKSRQSSSSDYSVAASLFNAVTGARGRFWMQRYGSLTSPRVKRISGSKNFRSPPEKTFATISATSGLTYPRGKQHHELTILRTRTFNFCGFQLAGVC
jgi:hypothetical protein